MFRVALGAAAISSLFAYAQFNRAQGLAEDLTDAQGQFAQCEALLTATLEGDAIDDAIPDDLEGVTARPEWMLRGEHATR